MVADEVRITQLLCSYHFSLDLFSTTTQMDVILRDSYLTQNNALLYNAMPIAAFEENYQNIHSCLVNHPRAQQFVETLYQSKAKVVFAFVQHFFTAACQSTQRGKSMYSLLKHNGSKIRKNMLKTMSLRQLVDAIDEIINH